MLSLQKTLHYAGDAAVLINEFPEFLDVPVTFTIPAYRFTRQNQEQPYVREYLKNEVQKNVLSILSKEYKQAIETGLITSSDYIAFFNYYVSVFQNTPNSPFNYEKFIQSLQVDIGVEVEGKHSTFFALPFLLLSENETAVLSNRMFSVSASATTGNEAIKKIFNEKLIFINVQAVEKIRESLQNVSPATLFYFLSLSITINPQSTLVLKIPAFEILQRQFKAMGLDYSDEMHRQLTLVVQKHLNDLFDFVLEVPEIKPVLIKGNLSFTGTNPVTYADLNGYELIVDFKPASELSAASFISRKYNWDDTQEGEIPDRTVPFNFKENSDFVLNSNAAGKVRVSVRLFDGSIVWAKNFKPDDPQLQELNIKVKLVGATPINPVDNQEIEQTKVFLKGKVVEVSGKCILKDLTVILQAKAQATDAIWKVIGVSTTDVTGSFIMPYPIGIYEKAQAIVSSAPDSSIDVAVFTDEVHRKSGQTIANDFLYLLVSSAECLEELSKDDDCECHSPKNATPRLPSQEDLITSDKFSQDLGGGTCVNLTTPNRTLSEHSYYAIVRTSDPDIANYILQKQTEAADADGFTKVKFTLGNGKKMERSEVSFENTIHWQDAPDTKDKDNHLSIYQAVSVAHGHLLTYKSVLKADGYSLGDLLYSLPLAPGQKKQIVVYDWKRSLQGSETQELTQREGVNASVVNDRAIIDSLSGGIDEALRGQSSANTGGISAGLGVGAMLGPVGAVLGVSGGYSTSSSKASQNSSRNTVQAFSEVLRNSVMQSAIAYRQLNGTVIDTITEGQQFGTTTEVIANHNHCHSLTMLYFEVLRHYAVFQELAQVEECIFVPLVMTNFSMENIHKWRDVLAARLLYRPSSTYMYYFNRNPLVKAFDANDRVLTNWANVDFPAGRYCDEAIINVKGSMNLRVHLPRPKTKYDRIKSLPVVSKTVTHEEFDAGTTARSAAAAVLTGGLSLLFGGGSTTHTVSEQILVRAQIFDAFMSLDANFQTANPANCIRVTDFRPKSMTFYGITIPLSGLDFFENGINDKLEWGAYARILGYTANDDGLYDMLDYYFKGRLIAEWDSIFNTDIVPLVFDKMLKSITVQHIGIDLTSTSRYKGGERIMTANIQGSTSLRRIDFPDHIKISSNSATVKLLNGHVTFDVESIRITYATSHFNGVLFSGKIQDSLLEKDTDLFIPVSSEEKRNPRKEDKFIVNELITHLNSNLEYYNKVLWYNLDADRRFLLLDGFHIQVYDDLNQPAAFKSLASIVKNQLIGITGNSLIFPVAAGVKVDRSYIIVNKEGEDEETKTTLFDHYKPLTPVPPYRISMPTKGVFAEAVQGSCDACEKVVDNTSQDWDAFKTDEPTAIGTVTVPTPTPTDWKAAFKDFATPIVNIQNAPAAPAPGAGLAGLSDLLGKSDIFKDVTGLAENQKNAMATYLSNQENAKAFGQMAKDMAMQAHNTQNAGKIKDAINDAQNSGAITKEQAGQLTKDHIQQMIDGGESVKADAQKANTKPSLTDAAVKAADQGKAVKAASTDTATGKSETVEIEGSIPENILAKVPGIVPKMKQENAMACWATVATMMMSWKTGVSTSIQDALAVAGAQYVQKFNNGEGLLSSEKEAFITALEMVGEPPASYPVQQYIDWINTYGPLWITTDSSSATGLFSPHARILTKITGTGAADGSGTYFTFIDPASGNEVRELFTDFLSVYEQMVTDNPSELFIQIVHFSDTLSTEGGGPKAPKNGELTLYGHFVWDPAISDATEKQLLVDGKWHPSIMDFMAVTGQSAKFGVGNFSALVGAIAEYPNGSISRLNFFTHSNADIMGIAGTMDSTNVFFTAQITDTEINDYVTTDTLFNYNGKTYSIADIRKKFKAEAKFVLYGCHLGANISLLKALNKFLNVQVIGFKKEIIFCPPAQTTAAFKRTGIKIGINKPGGCANSVVDWRGLINDTEAVKVP